MPARAHVAVFGILLTLTLSSLAVAQTGKVVAVEGGSIEGSLSHGILAFKGIPYAAPPVGDLRWRAPQPVLPWAGTRAAVEYGHDCMQVAIDDVAAPLGSTPSEDCLVLNVWRPSEIHADAPLPVMVWIHGNGYLNGGSSASVFDGSSLAERGLIVVSFNYRLGRLGFFAHPALLAAQPGEAGNFGTMDQMAALKWVQANVTAFGGDLAKVTLVGESAGGASVLNLLTSPLTDGLFRGVVIMSGGGRSALVGRPMTGGTPEQPSAEQGDTAFAKSLGIDGADAAALAALRALPGQSVIGDLSLPVLLESVLAGSQDFPGTAMIDGVIVTAEPESIFRRHEAKRVPIIIGTTVTDLPLILPPRDDPFSWFGESAEKAAAVYNPGGLPPWLLTLLIGSDLTMHEPARFAARSMTDAGNAAWLYLFTYVAESVPDRAPGASHADELPYMFDTLDARYGAASVTEKDRQMADRFSGYIANFVKSGDPNGDGLPAWPKFDPAQYDLMNFTLDDGPVFGPDPRTPRIQLVEQVFDAASSAALPAEVMDATWEWVSFTSSVEEVTVDTPKQYTVTFQSDGRVALKADCNRGTAAYAVAADRKITFGPLALTRALCLEGSLSDRFVHEFGRAMSYFLQDGDLFLELPVDSGTLRFRRQG